MAKNKLQQKTLKSAHFAGDFMVDAAHIDDDPHDPLVFEVTVSDGVNQYTERHAYGSYANSTGDAQNPVGPPMLASDIQAWLDVYRQQTTDRFAFIRAAAQMVQALK